MILSAHQPAYLPWLGYLERISLSDKFVILDQVQFEKNSFINRNKIKTKEDALWLTIPVNLKNHLEGTIKNTTINTNDKWKIKHWKTIQQNYSKAPFFDFHKDFFEEAYKKKWKTINEVNHFFLKYLLKLFDIKTEILFLSDLNVKKKKNDLIIELCDLFSADVFIFGSQGKNYFSEEKFKKNSIKTLFHNFEYKVYKQLGEKFIPNLSSLDLIMNENPKNLAKYVKKNL